MLNGKLVPAVSPDPTFARGHRNHRQDRNAALQQRDFWKERLVEYRHLIHRCARRKGGQTLNTKGPRGPLNGAEAANSELAEALLCCVN